MKYVVVLCAKGTRGHRALELYCNLIQKSTFTPISCFTMWTYFNQVNTNMFSFGGIAWNALIDPTPMLL